jgi:hypothetical protein
LLLEAPAGPIEGEMIVATDVLLASLEDEILSAEEAPWYEAPSTVTESDGEQLDRELPSTESEDEASAILPVTASIIDEVLPVEENEPLEEVYPEDATDEDALTEVESAEIIPAVLAKAPTFDDTANRPAPGDGVRLEKALSAIDSLALPSGRTLAEIETVWSEGQFAPRRDVMTALAWLELTLTPAQPEPHSYVPSLALDETQLIEQMPDDPDAVLAWLEQMSDEGASPSTTPAYSQASPEQPEAGSSLYDLPEDELLEADLLAMPDDPDEAMIWLESLARGGEPPPMPSKVELATSERLELSDDNPTSELGLEHRSIDEESDTPDSPGEPNDVENEA